MSAPLTTSNLSGLSIASIGQSVDALSPEAAGEDEIMKWLDLTEALLQRAREIRDRMEEIAVAWIVANHPIEIGDIRYSVGYTKSVRCLDTRRCLRSVLDSCGGDLDAIAAYLRSDPWKYGSVRSLVGERAFGELFRQESKPRLVDGRPKQQLLKLKNAFSSAAASRKRKIED